MVCGNMDVEVVQESYMDDLYDNTEEKVTTEALTIITKMNHILFSRLAQQFSA